MVESQIHVRRVREGWHDTLRGIHVSFVPGVSILNDTGGQCHTVEATLQVDERFSGVTQRRPLTAHDRAEISTV